MRQICCLPDSHSHGVSGIRLRLARQMHHGQRCRNNRQNRGRGQDAVGADGRIDRSALSAVVFSDDEALRRLNSIVHAAVRADFRRWAEETPSEVLFVESAILYQSGLDREVGEVWEVCAPMELRLERVMKRNGFTEQQVLARMSASPGNPDNKRRLRAPSPSDRGRHLKEIVAPPKTPIAGQRRKSQPGSNCRSGLALSDDNV